MDTEELSTETAEQKQRGTEDSDALRKKAEQAEMRANQLANELASIKKAKEEAEAERLKEQEQYKELYEQSQAKLAEVEKQEAEAKLKREAKSEMDKINKEFSKEVLEVASAAGITLGNAEQAADYRSRLEAIQTKITSTNSPVRGNNPAPRVDTTPEKDQMLKGMRWGDKKATSNYIGNMGAVKQMRQMAGIETPNQ